MDELLEGAGSKKEELLDGTSPAFPGWTEDEELLDLAPFPSPDGRATPGADEYVQNGENAHSSGF